MPIPTYDWNDDELHVGDIVRRRDDQCGMSWLESTRAEIIAIDPNDPCRMRLRVLNFADTGIHEGMFWRSYNFVLVSRGKKKPRYATKRVYIHNG